jgi:hypothetical protein
MIFSTSVCTELLIFNMVLVIQNSDNARISRLSPSLSKSERLEEAKKTWQRLSETERDKVFILPLQELFESAALLASGM